MRRGKIEQKIAILKCCTVIRLVTHIIHKTNIQYAYLIPLIDQLISSGYLKVIRGKYYEITIAGLFILGKWQEIEKLLEGGINVKGESEKDS